MGDKFIPNGELEFETKATQMASLISNDPGRFMLDRDDADALCAAVEAFCEARKVAGNSRQRTPSALILKREARARAVVQVQRCANVIRASDRISAADKSLVGIKVRTGKPQRRKCPDEPIVLKFRGAEGTGTSGGRHVLEFEPGYDIHGLQKRGGASRVELFVDLIAPGEPVPKAPRQHRPMDPGYLRSYTKSPIKVLHPVPPTPMLVVYWARWADAPGEVGPFSQTCVARVEGFPSIHPSNLLGGIPQVRQLETEPKQIESPKTPAGPFVEGSCVERRALPEGPKAAEGEMKQLELKPKDDRETNAEAA